jgi:hypothetical protein
MNPIIAPILLAETASGLFIFSIVVFGALILIWRLREWFRDSALAIPCAYCGDLMPQTAMFCPNCRAIRKA